MTLTDDEVERLAAEGFFVRPRFVGPAAALQIASDVRSRHAQGEFRPAGIGRLHQRQPSVRDDETCWLDPTQPSAALLGGAFESLQQALNEALHWGLRRFDIQLSRYDGNGAHYQLHRDALVGEDNRRITAIVYLNPEWRPEHGGLLRLPGSEVAPSLDRLVVFLSEKVEHEVLPCYAPRYAATAWFYARDALL